MPSGTNGQVMYLFIGAVLSFLATSLVEGLKNWLVARGRREVYRTYARLQMSSVLNVLSKLKYSYESNSRYMPRDIALLVTAMEPLNSLRSDTTILPKSNNQEKLIELIADLNLYIADIKDLSAQNVSIVPAAESGTAVEGTDKTTTITNSWIEKNIELIDLRRRCEELIKSFA